jgi:hypothetical protein|tara:strand:+ start:682 stop:882 length:201 start_codon:yes stop_codon:yes gene_type:complete
MSFKNELLTEFTEDQFNALQKRFNLQPEVVEVRTFNKLEAFKDALFFTAMFGLLALLVTPIVFIIT